MAGVDPRPVAWGFIGAGGVAQRRMLPAVAGHPEIRVAAVMVRDAVRSADIAREFGAGHSYDRVEDLVADPNVEAVYIATPPDVHLAHVEAAAAAGKDILLEKPMALNAEDCDAMLAAAGKAGVRLSVCFPMRHTSAVQTLRTWLEAGELGDLTYLRAQMVKWYPLDPNVWRADPRQSGGGVIMDLGSHLIDLAVHLGGPLARVEAVAARRAWQIDVEDSGLLLLQFESGALGVLELSFAVAGGGNAVELYGTRAIATQTAGGLRRTGPDGTVEVALHDDDVYRLELLDFSRALRENRAALTHGEDGRINTAWLEAAYRSAKGAQ